MRAPPLSRPGSAEKQWGGFRNAASLLPPSWTAVYQLLVKPALAWTVRGTQRLAPTGGPY